MLRHTRALLSLAVIALDAAALGAQNCRGVASGDDRAALEFGFASARASTFGAELAFQFDHPLSVNAEAALTRYPTPDPARARLAAGVGIEIAEFGRTGLCATMGVEGERIGDLMARRIPIGIAFGWTTPLAGIARGIGFTVEPFYVHSHERIERFAHTSNFVSGRAGVLYVARRLLLGLEYEHAFDADARWHTTARIGFTFH